MLELPKAELHVHLEGTIRPKLAMQLAERNGLKFPKHILTDDQKGYHSKDFLDFLHHYDLIAFLIKTPQDYYDLTYDYLIESAKQGCIYTEMMYSPDHAEKSSGIPSHEHLLAIDQAIQDAQRNMGIIGRIIITGVRHFGPEACEKVALEACDETVSSIVGFGLGGNEIDFKPDLFVKTFEIARAGGLHCTIHAGEFGSAESMQYAIKHCKIQRIGHGVAAAKSPETIEMLLEHHIHLEICPSSNIKLGLFQELSEHPIDNLLKQGVSLSISSDDPPFMNTSIAQEYQKVQTTFQYSTNQMLKLTQNAISHAFIQDDIKQALAVRCI